MLLTVLVLALLAVAQADIQEKSKVTEKRGVINSSPSASALAQQQAYVAKLRQYEQAQAQAQAEAQSNAGVQYVQQNSKYTASPVAYNSGAAPAVQYQPQQQAYAQPALKQAALPSYSKASYQLSQPSPAQHYSLAADVSSFSYTSPLVKYSNLGLLSQQTGKVSDETAITYQSAAPAPAPKVNYYQTAAAPSPVQTRVQYVPQYESYSQEEQRSVQPAQNYVVASPKYINAAPQAAPQQRYVYVSAQEAAQSQAQAASAAPQRYVYQAVPQSQYQAQQNQPQYERQAYQQQAAPSVPQAVFAQIPQQYQPVQYFSQSPTKQGIIYAN